MILVLSSFAAIAGVQVQDSFSAEPVLLVVKRFVVVGDNPLSESETKAILASHLGPHSSLSSLEGAATALEKVIRKEGYAFHRVIVPAQRPVDGVVKLQILQFPLRNVTVTGNKNFSKENILRSLPALKPGAPPNVKELSRDLRLANEHPAKRAAIRVKESASRDGLDAEVRVQDVRPRQTFIGLTGGTRDADNSINQNTGYTRLTVAHQESNLFDRDHVLTLAYTTSPEYVNGVTQLGAFYWLPLYGHNSTLSAYFTHSDVDNGTIGVGGSSFDVSGRGDFWGLRGTYLLPKLGEFGQDISLALDNRTFKSHIGAVGFVGAGSIADTTYGSRPLSLRYSARREGVGATLGGYAEYLVNIDGGQGNDDQAYAVFSLPGRDVGQSWEAIRYGLDASYALPAKWTLSGRFRGQYSHEPLVPGEQFGIGGAASVRGLRERETSGDKGYFFSIEAQGPAMTSAGVVPFFYYDQGGRSYVAPNPPFPARDTASSVGGGIRWTWRKQLEVSVTAATVLQGVSGSTSNNTSSGHDKLYFSLFYHF